MDRDKSTFGSFGEFLHDEAEAPQSKPISDFFVVLVAINS